MNYQRIYNIIIQKAISSNRKKTKSNYYERHHIIPKCLGGGNEKDNLVLLTAKEHFICHRLLCKIYPDNNRLYFAFWAMCNQLKGDIKRNYKVSARTYQQAKSDFIKVNSLLHSGKTISLKQIESSRTYMLSSKNPMRGKKGVLSPLYKKERSKETKNKISLTKIKNPHRNYNYKGDYITPKGVFHTLNTAAVANSTTIDKIRYRCKINSRYPGWGFLPLPRK